MGWDIGTGVITRNIVNFPDDYSQAKGDTRNGFLYDYSTSGNCFWGSPTGPPNSNPNDDTNTDCEDQDNYGISIPGVLSGRFFGTVNDNKVFWHMKSYSGKINITPQYSLSGRISNWTVTTTDGTKFIFAKSVNTRIDHIWTKSYQIYNGATGFFINHDVTSDRDYMDKNRPFPYAWYLTQILSNDYADVTGNGPTDDDYGNWITIAYEDYPCSTGDGYCTFRTPNFWPSKQPHPYENNCANLDPRLGTYRNEICGYQYQGWDIIDLNKAAMSFTKREVSIQRTYPKEIITPINKLTFTKSLNSYGTYSRADLTNSNNLDAPPVLDYLTLYSKIDNTRISKVDFSFASPSEELAKGVEAVPTRGKLTLLSVQTYGETDDSKLPPTKLTYGYNPNYNALAYDYWGYYTSNQANPSNPPTLDGYNFNHDPSSIDIFNYNTCSQGADGMKNVFDLIWWWWQTDDPHKTQNYEFNFGPYAAAWSLKRVNYSTGGYIEYNYENDRYNFDQDKNLISGIPLTPACESNQALFENLGGGLRLKSKAISDGLGNTAPHTITINYEYGDGVSTDQLNFVSSMKLDWNQLGPYNNLYVGYEWVKEILPNLFGYTTTSYTTARDYPSRQTAQVLGNNYGTCVDNIPANWKFAWMKAYLDDLEFERGLVKKVEIRKSANELVSSIENFYNIGDFSDRSDPHTINDPNEPSSIQAEIRDDTHSWDTEGPSYNKCGDLNYNYFIYSGWARLKRTVKTIDGVTSTTLYSNYDVSNGQPKRVEEINNKADNTIVKRISITNFAHEYYPWAIDKNMFNLPLFASVYKDTELTESNRLSWQENGYDNFGTVGQPRYYLKWQSAWLDSNHDNILSNSEKITTSRINTYNYYGQPTDTLDANSKITKFYFGGPSGQECTNTPSDNRYKNAFLTCLEKVDSTPPIIYHKVKTHYNNDGTISEIIDENNQVTKFQYDEFNRIKESTLPAESNPTVKYDYQYALGLAALSPSQRTALMAEECANGISPKCTNRVRTTTILNYRGTTAESEFKIAKYWDGLGRVHMNDIMITPGEKHIRTLNEYNEIGQIDSTSDIFLEDRRDWIRKSPQKWDIFSRILIFFGLRNEETQSIQILVPDSEDNRFNGDFSLPTFNSNINPITGQLIKDPEVIEPGPGGGGTPIIPNPDKSYITYEKSPLVRPDTAYAFDGDPVNGPDPDDPQVKSEFNSEVPDDQCRLEVDFCQSTMTVDRMLGQGPNPITEEDCRIMGIEYCSGCPTPEEWSWCRQIQVLPCSYDCDGSSNADCNGGEHVQGSNILCDRLQSSSVGTIGQPPNVQYQCFARCASEPVSYKKEVQFSTRNTYTKVTDEELKTVKTYSDKFGNNLRTIAAEESTEDKSITDYTYDVLGRVIGVVNPEGQATVNEYDTLGRLIKSTSPDFGIINTTYFNNGNIQTRNHNGIITTYQYDDLNRVTRIDYSFNNLDPNFPLALYPATPPGPIVYYYDTYSQNSIGSGNPDLRVSSRCGLVVGYPSLGFPNGRLVAVEKYSDIGLTQLSSLRCLIYNEKGQIIEQIDRISPSNSLYKTRYEYNLAGSLIRSINPAPANVGTTYDYNNLNQIVQMNINNYLVNPSFEVNNNNDNLPDNWEIDGDAINDFYVLGYDNNPSYLPPQGSYAYRIKVKPSMTNKGISQNVKVINAQEYTLSFKFNLRWSNPPNAANGFKVVIKKEDNTQISTTSFVANTYSSNTWHTGTVTFTASCNQVISCINKIKFLNYDGAIINEWHLDSIKLEPGDSATDFSFANYQYNYDQTVRNLLFGNGVQTNFFYTPRKWMTVIDTKGPAPNYNQLFARTYSYTSSGDVSGIYDNYDLVHPGDTSTLNDLEWFGYDDLHRLTSDTIDGDLGLGANAVLSYNYDKAGNRLLESLTNSPGNNFQSNYQYTSPISKNRLNSVTRTGINPSTTLFTYDTRGNTITQSNPLAFYYYNADNMLSKVCFNLACNNYESYSYNSDGLRILKYTNPSPGTFTRTYYIYDISGNLIFEDYEYNV